MVFRAADVLAVVDELGADGRVIALLRAKREGMAGSGTVEAQPAETDPRPAPETQAGSDATNAAAGGAMSPGDKESAVLREPQGNGKAAQAEAMTVERLAEFIFSMRAQVGHHQDKLYGAALRDSDLGMFTRAKFLAAYGLVYQSRPHRPPATGWLMREPYKSRAEKGAKHTE